MAKITSSRPMAIGARKSTFQGKQIGRCGYNKNLVEEIIRSIEGSHKERAMNSIFADLEILV
ncbi:MAG: hypothetical protein ACXVLT_07005 [Flavisolibacter sp.]